MVGGGGIVGGGVVGGGSVGGGVVGGGDVVVVGRLVEVVGRRVVGVVPRLGGFVLVTASPSTAAATAPAPFGC